MKSFNFGWKSCPSKIVSVEPARRVLKNPDNLRVEKGKNGLPEVRKQERRAAVGGLLRCDLQEELV
jgi:hypothetical protein